MSHFTTLTLSVLLICCCSQASAQSEWTSQASGSQDPLSAAVFGGGQFVAVGDPGKILSSPDGVTWTGQISGTEEALRGLTYGNGLFLATGSAGTALTSPDGVTWTPRTTSTIELLSGAAFGNGTFVAVGGSGTVLHSTDGINWNAGSVSTSAFLQSVCFGGGRFVAVGSSGRIVHSSDGQNWSIAASGAGAFNDYFYSASYLGGTYVVTGKDGAILSSTDASNWTRQALVAFTRLRSLTTNGSQFVAVGDPIPAADGFPSVPGKILTSPDGVAWAAADLDVGGDLNGITFGSGKYVIVGAPDGAPARALILTSEDDQPSCLTFEAWRQLVFNPSERDDVLISGPDADPDLDGLSNFIEFALGLEPKDPADQGGALPKITKNTGGSAAISFARPADRVGCVTYSVSYSPDLANWFALMEPEEIESETSGIQSVNFIDPDTDSVRRFYKLVFEER